jgi:hypothetical protein
VAEPKDHIVVIGSITKGIYAQDEIVLIKKTPFDQNELGRLSDYARANGFNVLYAPGDRTSKLAGLLAVDEPARRKAIAAEHFDVEATWDNDPFFYNVAKWKNFVAADEGTPFFMPGSYMGQLVLVLMVAQSTLLGSVLIFAPLVLGARGALAGHNVASFLAYFLALGVGFMFVEISFVQSFVLFLGSPTYALSVTIFSLLLFSGIGSLVSTRFSSEPEKTLGRLAPVLAALVVVYAFGLSRVFGAALHLELGTRIAIAVLAQMPLGLLLGMFMPLGVASIARVQPRLVPWAWGVNGVGSVAGTTLAVLLAMAVGFRAVSITAAVIYLIGTFLLLRARK